MAIKQTNLLARFAQGAQVGNSLEQAGRQRTARNALADLMTGADNPNARNVLAQADPATAMQYQTFEAEQEAARAEQQAKKDAQTALTLRGYLSQGNIPLAAQLIQQEPDTPEKQQALQWLEQGQIEPLVGMVDTAIDRATRMGVLKAPQKPPQAPSSVREYQFAQQQGYKGSYQDWLAEQESGINIDFSGLAQKELVKDLGDRRESINEQKNAALTVARLANRINQQIQEGGAETVGPVGVLNRLGDSVKSQARGLARSFDLSLNPENYDFGNLETAEMSAATRSNILSLAFAIARSREPGGRLSDTEVQQALNTISANSGSPGQINASLREVVRESVQAVDQRVALEQSAFAGSPIKPPSPLSADLERLNIPIELERRQPELPEGAERVGEVDGKPVVRINGQLKVMDYASP